MDALTFLKKTTELGASDLFIVAGLPLSYKKSGQLIELTSERIMPENTEILIREIYSLAGDRDISHFLKTGDDDFSFAVSGLSRFRVNTYMQRSSMAAVIRVITFHLPNPSDLGIPPEIIDLGTHNKGLVLVTGPAGSGKSTTLACIIDAINSTMEKHIITLEDPLEFLHSHKKSIVSQRNLYGYRKLYHCPACFSQTEPRRYSAWRNARSRDNGCCHDGCRNRTSGLFYPSYVRCCKYY